MAAEFDADYYRSHLGPPYRWGEPHWEQFFGRIADEIVSSVRPAAVLDAGCAVGFLVAALRQRGVEAYGIDVSDYAIGQVPLEISDYCRVASVTDELEQSYDLIVCIEVLEHLPPELASSAVGNLTDHTDVVLFSSTPDDFRETTHQNVQPMERWIELFARRGFYRDVDHDASFVAPHAVLLRRSAKNAVEIVRDYERWHWRHRSAVTQLREELQLAQAGRMEAQRRMSDLADEARLSGERAEQLESTLREALEVVDEKDAALSVARREAAEQAGMLRTIETTATWRLSAPVRGFLGQHPRTHGVLKRAGGRAKSAFVPRSSIDRRTQRQRELEATGAGFDAYPDWVEFYDTFSRADLSAMRAMARSLRYRPTFSILMAVCDPPVAYLDRAIQSVLAQAYDDWELCIADDASTDPLVHRAIEEAAQEDARVKVAWRSERGGISAAQNSALELASGEFAAFLDHDDILRHHALLLVALELNRDPNLQVLYSDEDKIDEAGIRFDPYFKPDWDATLLLGQNYLCHFLVCRRDRIVASGGLRSAYDGAQDWDLVLRLSREVPSAAIRHIPHVLYHWRVHASSTAQGAQAKPHAAEAGRRAAQEFLRSAGIRASVETLAPGGNRLRYELPGQCPRVDVVVPTGLLHPHVGLCLESIVQRTRYPNWLLHLVVDEERLSRRGDRVPALVRDDPRVRLCPTNRRPFNYAHSVNLGASQGDGAVICLLNDDVEVITESWLDEMVARVVQEGIGAVGSRLYYPDDTVQHAGVVLGLGGVAGHVHAHIDRGASGYFNRAVLDQELSAVTAACMVVRREAFDAVGGLDERFAIAFNDVDFCLKLRKAGWRIVWTPCAELYHRESTSVGRPDDPARAERFRGEVGLMQEKWGDMLSSDPSYNPNLSLIAANTPAFPPRTAYPWSQRRSHRSIRSLILPR